MFKLNHYVICQLICFLFILFGTVVYAQTINIGGLKDVFKAKPIVFNGGASANNSFYAGNSNRDPYNYTLQGNINANLFGQLHLPFTFSLSNVGSTYSYPSPPNRLDLHPTYKWISGHIGNVTMSFSPYTLNGHPFSGVGLDLTPSGPWKVSVMTGRLQKAVAYDLKNPKVLPAYHRMGYGSKIVYEKLGYKLGLSAFYAGDERMSLVGMPDSLALSPQQNLAVCYTAQFRLGHGFDVQMEYGNSAITLDNSDTTTVRSTHNYLKSLMGERGQTAFYHAIKLGVSYTFMKTTLGLGYERVDPGYRTLGAYYFNNDFENMTINVSRALLKDKMLLSGNIGLQYDNLDGKKSATTHRMVGSMNISCTPTERWQFNGNYSSFRTHMNIQSPFQKINQLPSFSNVDTLNFVQISQSAQVNSMLTTRKDECRNHQLGVNIAFQDASDQRVGGVCKKGNGSQIYNLATSYNMLYLKKSIQVNLSYTISHNRTDFNHSLTHGPSAQASTKLLNKNMTTGLLTSYNTSTQRGIQQNSTFNVRLSVAYAVFKAHNLSLALMNQYRSTRNKIQTSDLMGTLGYNWSF